MQQPVQNFFFYFTLIAAMQGTVLAVSLILKRSNFPANRILAFWLSLVVADLLMSAAIIGGAPADYANLMIVKYGWPFLHGPCLYLYSRYLTAPEKRRWSDLLHFVPFAASKLMMIPYVFLASQEKIAYIEQVRVHPPLIHQLVSNALAIHGITYVILAILLVRNYRRQVLQFFSYKDNVYLSWLNAMLVINLVIWGLVLVNRVLLHAGYQSPVDFYVYTGAALWIFAVGYFGFNQPEIFAGKAAPEKEDEFEAVEKYAKTRISEERREEIRRKLLDYMATKPWLENTLTIKDISNETGFPIHHISQVINEVFGENLFSFINRHRLDEAKSRLADPKLRETNVLHIALDCGFNSKSSFNSLFKQHTGITPSEFRRQAYQNA